MKVAILAGSGHLPEISAQALKKDGVETIAIAFQEGAEAEELRKIVPKVYILNIAKIGKIFKTLKKEGITHVLMIGKIHKTILDGGIKPDLRAIFMLARLKDRNNDTIMYAIVDGLKKRGITTMEQSAVLKDIVPQAGVFTKNKPDKSTLADVAFAYTVAVELGRLDVGQTVVSKKKTIMSVESAEGTDKTIARGCTLANGGAVVVKAAKPSQDLRFDLPVVGMDTFQAVGESGGKVLAVEAGKTLVVAMDECIKYADSKGMVFLAFEPNKFYDAKLFPEAK